MSGYESRGMAGSHTRPQNTSALLRVFAVLTVSEGQGKQLLRDGTIGLTAQTG
jgi:hypothetical protein